jgi:outer membrane protein TolC
MGAPPERAPQLLASDAPAPGTPPSAKQVEAALRRGSVELAELEVEVELARTRAEVAGESSRPRLDLEGYVESYGESERVLGAAERAGRLRWITVHVGAVFELPLDDSRRHAEKQSSLLALRIAEQNLRATRDRLAAEATLAVSEARTAEGRVALSEKTVSVAEQAYEAARARFELGGAIAIQVQQAEEEVRRARLRLARARVDSIQARIISEHLAGALLARYAKS